VKWLWFENKLLVAPNKRVDIIVGYNFYPKIACPSISRDTLDILDIN
jgi:hypothetical protein